MSCPTITPEKLPSIMEELRNVPACVDVDRTSIPYGHGLQMVEELSCQNITPEKAPSITDELRIAACVEVNDTSIQQTQHTVEEHQMKAACVEVNGTSIQHAHHTVEEHPKLSVISTFMTKSYDDKLNACYQSMYDMKNEIEKVQYSMLNLNDKITHESKMQRIEWALNNVGSNSPVGTFEYYDSELSKYCTNPSTNCVRGILLSFRQGTGIHLPQNVSMNNFRYNDRSIEEKETLRIEVHDKLSNQIHILIGTKPRIVSDDTGRSVIYYS